jgi:SAM-dependent methyltransferase
VTQATLDSTATPPAPDRDPGRGGPTNPFADQTDFDAVAEAYDESLPAHVVEHYLAKRLAFIREHTRPGPTLDVGCGTGILAARVAASGYPTTGLDFSRGMLRVMTQRRPDLGAVAGSGTHLPFPDDTFALTYCVAVMHHVADPVAVRQTLTEMARVTRPGGHVLIWDHNPRNPYWPLLMKRVPQDTGAERLIPEREIVDGLAAGGARPLLSQPLGFVPDFAPRRLLPAVAALERVVEAAPVLNRLCAHNVILAVKETPPLR